MSIISRRRFLKDSTFLVAQSLLFSACAKSSLFSKNTPSILLTPDFLEYQSHYKGHNSRFHHITPRYMAMPRNSEELVSVLRFAKLEGLPLHTRSGGHCFEDHNTGPGILLDLQRMQNIKVDATHGLFTTEAGVRTGQFAVALGQNGYSLPLASCLAVGVSGYTLGGGYGFSSRQQGLGCDAMKSAKLILSGGEQVEASEKKNPDLLWALKGGGGGQIGIVTEMTFQALKAKPLTVFMSEVSLQNLNSLTSLWKEYLLSGSTDLTVILYLSSGPNGMNDPLLLAQFEGPKDKAEKALKPFLKICKSRELIEKDFLNAQIFFGGSLNAPISFAQFKSKSHYFNKQLPTSVWDEGFHVLKEETQGSVALFCNPYGGAISRVKNTDTAFAHRDTLMGFQYRADWSTEEEKNQTLSKLNKLYEVFEPYQTGSYVNYCDDDLKDWKKSYYDQNFSKLDSIRKTWDPDRFFSHRQSV